MPFTTSELETITKAIGQGALSVKYGDKEVVYRSLEEMIRIKNMMETDLNATGTQQNKGRRFASFTKGLQ